MSRIQVLVTALMALSVTTANAGGSRYGEDCSETIPIYRTMNEAHAGTSVGTVCKKNLENFQARYTLSIPGEALEISTLVGDAICFGAGFAGGCSYQPKGLFNLWGVNDTTSLRCSAQNTEVSLRTIVIGRMDREGRMTESHTVYALYTTHRPCNMSRHMPLPQ